MPYEFEPRDLDGPRGTRDARGPEDPLDAAFERWRAERETVPRREIGGSISRELYELAEDCLVDVPVRADDASSLLLAHRESLTPEVGVFLSAAHERSAASVAFFDVTVPEPPKHLGYRLREGTTLVLDAPVHSTTGVDAEGLLVNRTDVATSFGYGPGAAFVNLGSCLAFGAEGAGAAVNLGEVRGSAGGEGPTVAVGGDGRGHRRVADADDVAANPGLRSYLDDLRDGLTGDREAVRAFLDGMEPSPRRAIERDLVAHLEG